MAAGLFSYLARRRWAGVGLAVLVEATILLPMAAADPSAVVGIPAAVAAAIAGTVAVVYGPHDGALVALGLAPWTLTAFAFPDSLSCGRRAAESAAIAAKEASCASRSC